MGVTGRVQPGESFNVEIVVRGTGARAGQAVLQLYVADKAASVSRPLRELKAFAKLHLQPGEQQTAPAGAGWIALV